MFRSKCTNSLRLHSPIALYPSNIGVFGKGLTPARKCAEKVAIGFVPTANPEL
jgi:hypothetical protein